MIINQLFEDPINAQKITTLAFRSGIPLALKKSMKNQSVFKAKPWFIGVALVSFFVTLAPFVDASSTSVGLVNKTSQNETQNSTPETEGVENSFFPLTQSPSLRPEDLQSTELPTPLLQSNEKRLNKQKMEILADTMDKISSEFQVPERLKLRTAFQER